MSGCGNKVKYTCSESKPAECVEYEGNINVNSSLEANSCKSAEEVIQDIYSQLEDINLSELGENCLEYLTEDGRIKVKTVLLKYEEEICNLKEEIEELKFIEKWKDYTLDVLWKINEIIEKINKTIDLYNSHYEL